MWHFINDKIRGVPWGILINVYALIGVGLYNLFSASSADIGQTKFHDQLIWVTVGTLVLIIGASINLRFIERYTIVGYVLLCGLLIAVDLLGVTTKGAQRWLPIGPIRLQPSELAKFIIILIVARSFTLTRAIGPFNLLRLWPQAIFVGIPTLLILAQPDLGTAGLVVMIAGMQLAFVRVGWRSVALVAILGFSGALIGWNFVLLDYQRERVMTFLNPMLDPRGSGFQSLQSMIAVGSGGLWGKGFMQGTQAQLDFLPERHTDFIFSVWAEEHGFVGAIMLLGLFALLILQILSVVERARDTFSALIAVGVASFFLFHLLINVSMVLGWFPVVGVPLTLLSYGGSHMLAAMACVGLLVAVERRRAAAQYGET